jgi:hypothetical protein
MLTLATLTLLALPALAQPADETTPQPDEEAAPELAIPADEAQDPPLALPAGAQPPLMQAPEATPPQPARAAVDAERVRLAREYKELRLSVLTETTFTPGTTTVHSGYVWGPPRRRYYHPVTVVHTPPMAHQSWGIYQGSQRLEVPDYLSITGQSTAALDLNNKIDRSESRARVGYTLGGVGVAAVVGGIVARGMADNKQTYVAGYWTSVGGVALSVGGFIGGGIASGRAERLARRPAEFMDLNSVQADIEQYNADLGQELGMDEGDRQLIEAGVYTGGGRRGPRGPW